MNSPELRGNGKHVYLKHKREQQDMQRKHAKDWVEAGISTYRPGQETYTTVVQKHLDSCEAGEYQPAKKTAEQVAGKDAGKLLNKQHPKKLRQALEANRNHPGMQRVQSVTGKSIQAAMSKGTVSNCLGALVDNHKIARRFETIEQEQQQAREEIQRLRERVQTLEVRHELEDEGKDWREEAKRIREAEPGISWRELGRRVDKSDTAVRKYLNPEQA